MHSGGVKSAQRAMEVLEFFADWRRPASVKEISQSLGYPQSSTSVLLRALADSGYFDHDPRTGMYMPSVRVLLSTEWIGEQLFSEQSLLRLMERVHEQTGYAVVIGVQEVIHVRYLHVLRPTRVDPFVTKTGSLRPLFRSGPGKMLLTVNTEREIALLLRKANALEPDPTLKLDLREVLKERETTQRNGYALSLGTSVPGAAALAILLPVPRGAKPMTLSVGGPMEEITHDREKLLRILREAVAPIRQAVSR